MFQSLDASADSSEDEAEDDDDEDLGAKALNKQWAELSLLLDSLKLVSSEKSKGRKKGTGVILETPEMRGIMEKMRKVEKEYMFNRKDASGLIACHSLTRRSDLSLDQSQARRRCYRGKTSSSRGRAIRASKRDRTRVGRQCLRR